MKAERRTFLVWTAVALAALLVDYALFWGVWGGWVNYDTQVQWDQVQSGAYTQWHPFVHTFLMMKLPSLVWNDYRVTVLWQVGCFAMAFGYLGFVLQKIGARTKWIVLGLVLTLLHPQTLFFMMTPLKDSAFAIAVLVSVAALMPVVCRGAAALRELRVWCPLASGLALASLFRHNGIFFSIPALVLALVSFAHSERRRDKIQRQPHAGCEQKVSGVLRGVPTAPQPSENAIFVMRRLRRDGDIAPLSALNGQDARSPMKGRQLIANCRNRRTDTSVI